MSDILVLKDLKVRIAKSELGQHWINNPLIKKDIWLAEELGYSKEITQAYSTHNIHFGNFELPWLKLLSKMTALTIMKQRYSLATLITRISYLRQLDAFLIDKGCINSGMLTNTILQEYCEQGNSRQKQATVDFATRLWKEEQWLDIFFIKSKDRSKKTTPQNKSIPEEVLHQIYENLDIFPSEIERFFRLQLVLGCRIGELILMPRQCLKSENGNWFLLRWIEKIKIWRFYQIHSSVAELVKEQQKFLNNQSSINAEFDKLFCKLSLSSKHGVKKARRFETEPIYFPQVISSSTIRYWINTFSKEVDLKDKYGNSFKLESHMFRHTKATIMAYCETEDEYIAAVLGHSSLDMLPHYRKRSLERLEKESKTKGYVDMYGRITSFKPRKRRYEQLADLLKVSTPLGECHRPTMLGDCQYRYACLSCDHHRITLEDKPRLEADFKSLQLDLSQSKSKGQERRVTEINRLLELIEVRLNGLKDLQNIKDK